MQKSTKITSVLHLFPPQKSELTAINSPQHPVCIKITDYSNNFPVFSSIPKTLDRFVFDEVISEPEIFSDLHETQQKVEVNSVLDVLDGLAAKLIAESHHGSSKLIVSYGAASSGHGILSFGVPSSEKCDKLPKAGILWSLLDAAGGDAKFCCFQLESSKIRDIMVQSNERLTDVGNVFEPHTENGSITPNSLEKDLQFVGNTYSNKIALEKALFTKRRVRATWHSLRKVIDRTSNQKYPLLSHILSQLGYENHQIGLDVCGTTCVLINLGPARQNASLLLVDMPACCTGSNLCDYSVSPELGADLRYAVTLKNVLSGASRTRDNIFARLLEGCVPEIYAGGGEVVQIASVQISDLERGQTVESLRMSGVLDERVGERYFAEAEVEQHDEPGSQNRGVNQKEQRQQNEVPGAGSLTAEQLLESAESSARQGAPNEQIGAAFSSAMKSVQINEEPEILQGANSRAENEEFLLTGEAEAAENENKTISVDELLDNFCETSAANESKGIGMDTISGLEGIQGQERADLYNNAQWQLETRTILEKMKTFLAGIKVD